MQDSVKQDRQKFLGGSDIPIIMGISPFKTRYKLLCEKAGIEEDTFKGDAYTEYGNIMEEKIRDHINNSNMVYGEAPFHEDKFEREPIGSEPIGIRCHCDGINEITVLEIKTTSKIHDNVNDYKYYLVQLLYYMIYFERRYGMLAVYERPNDMNTEFDMRRLQTFRIDREDYKDLIFEIGKAVVDFMIDLKEMKKNPFLEEEDFIPSDLVEVSDKIIALEAQLADMKRIEKQVKDFKEQLKAEMEKHKVKKWKTPSGCSICLVEDTPSTVEMVDELDLEAMKQDLPELFKSYTDGGYIKPVEKIKKGKAGYVRISIPKEKT